jgi:hypothetical protein
MRDRDYIEMKLSEGRRGLLARAAGWARRRGR